MYSETRFAEEDFLRALAQRLISPRAFAAIVVDAAAAVRLVVDVAHDGGCPDCGSADWFVVGDRHVRCRGCARTSPAFRKTPLSRLRITPLRLLAALHATHVDTRTPNAHAFAREHGSTPFRAWQLLHRTRRALFPLVPPNDALVDVVLGSCAKDNACVVAVSDDDVVTDRVVAAHIDDDEWPQPWQPPRTKKPARHLPLWLGRLRRWLSEHFRGVSRKHAWLYLAEFTDRHGRVRWLTSS